MKNIHVLPTDKPSRLVLDTVNKNLFLTTTKDFGTKIMQFQHIYITNSEEIKEGDWCLLDNNVGMSTGFQVLKCLKANVEDGEYDFEDETGLFYTGRCKKIILTTDQSLDGVQAIDDEFLEWFVKNPSCEEVEIECSGRNCIEEFGCTKEVCNGVKPLKIIIPKEEPTMVDKLKEYFNNTTKEQIKKDWDETCKQTEEIISPTIDEFLKAQEQFNKQETLEEAAESYAKPFDNRFWVVATFKDGAKWQQERMYSEEEVLRIITSCKEYLSFGDEFNDKEWFKQFKK